ncbi:MAG TPA: YciI family protein [Gaiellaceae bacterium]|nr:YciI family protein [Gaiellaceae bacterium]
MQYALLLYGNAEALAEATAEDWQSFNAGIGAVLARPNVAGYVRLQPVGTATTVREGQRGTLVTDGPFVDSKDFLGGFVLVEAENLDGALAVADELHRVGATVGVEVRPVNEEPLPGA